MSNNNGFLDFIIILITAFSGGTIARKLRLPLLTGYLLAGVVSGTLLSKFISNGESVKVIAQAGVALLLFTLGLEFSISRLKELGQVIIFGSLIQILLTILFGLLIFPFFGFDFYSSLFLGCLFSLSSTAAAVKILSDKGELDTLHGEMAMGWLFMQDLYTLPLIILLPSVGIMMKGEHVGLGPVILFFQSFFAALIIFFLIISFGKRAVPFLFEKIADLGSRELVLLAAVVFCLLFSYGFEKAGISFAIGAFVAGVLLSSSSAHHGIFAEIRPLRDFFSIIFFVSLGFILNPVFLMNAWQTILVMVILVILLKFLISFVLIILLGFHAKTATLVSLSLISVGEFAFILALLGLSTDLISSEIYQTILAVSFITLVISMPLIERADRIYYWMLKFLKNSFPWLVGLFEKSDLLPSLTDNNIKDHVIVLGHGRVGRHICRSLAISQIPFVVVDNNHHLVQKLHKEGMNVIYGDPAQIDVLKFARIAEAKVLILAYADRHTQEVVVTNALTLNPALSIIVRTHFEEDRKKLQSLGVFLVVQPEFEAAVSITEKLLYLFKSDPSQMKNKLDSIRMEHGY